MLVCWIKKVPCLKQNVMGKTLETGYYVHTITIIIVKQCKQHKYWELKNQSKISAQFLDMPHLFCATCTKFWVDQFAGEYSCKLNYFMSIESWVLIVK